jgi:hypothetical protein
VTVIREQLRSQRLHPTEDLAVPPLCGGDL